MTTNLLVPSGWRLAARDYGDLRVRRKDAKEGRVLGVLTWEPEWGEGEVLLHPSFLRSNRTVIGDALSDWIGLLDQELRAWGSEQ